VCEDGVPVHKCNRTLCENKVCMGFPDAKCMINPCGGCTTRWIDPEGNHVNCEHGLSQCQSEMQRIMNSVSWINQGLSVAADNTRSNEAAEEYQRENQSLDDLILSTLGTTSDLFATTLNSLLLQASATPSTSAEEKIVVDKNEDIYTRTSSTPIFSTTGYGINPVVGWSTSSFTIVNGKNGKAEESTEESLESQKTTKTAKSIADIIEEMMKTGQSGSTTPFDDYMDLMSTSSQMTPEIIDMGSFSVSQHQQSEDNGGSAPRSKRGGQI